MTPKEIAMDRVRCLRDDVSLEEIREELDVLISIEEGLEDFRQGRVHSFEQVIEMSESWITRPSGQTVP